jgi:O-antigen/teichoic acid export membrane protein
VAFGFLATLDAIFVLLIYLLVSVACVRFFWVKRRAQFSVVRHSVIPVLCSLITGGIAALAIIPTGSAPLSYVPYVVGGWLALGLIVVVVMGGKLRAVPATVAEDAPGAASGS